MAKRGERLPWKVTWRWENGVSGTEAKHSEDAAQALVALLHRNAASRGMTVEVQVSHKEKEKP